MQLSVADILNGPNAFKFNVVGGCFAGTRLFLEPVIISNADRAFDQSSESLITATQEIILVGCDRVQSDVKHFAKAFVGSNRFAIPLSASICPRGNLVFRAAAFAVFVPAKHLLILLSIK